MSKINFEKIYVTIGWMIIILFASILAVITIGSLVILIFDQWIYEI